MKPTIILSIVLLSLAACSQGRPSQGFITSSLADAYTPLSQRNFVIFERAAAAMVVAPNIAVTNAHNSNLVPDNAILAHSQDYDLLFFRSDKSSVPPTAAPRIGQRVIAYGQSAGDELREARGVITSLNETVASRCDQCQVQMGIAFEADAGEGFSGGPVVDAETGAVVAIVFGYRDDPNGGSSRLMFAYDIALVTAEMKRLLSADGS